MDLCGDVATAQPLTLCPDAATIHVGSLATGYGFSSGTPLWIVFTNWATKHKTNFNATRVGAVLTIPNIDWIPFPDYTYLVEVVGRASYGQPVKQRFHPFQYDTTTSTYINTVASYDAVYVTFQKVYDEDLLLQEYTQQYITL